MIPDVHCHLDQIEDPDAALAEALAAGVGPILAVAMDARAAEVNLKLRERHRGHLLCGIGLHPSRVAEMTPEHQREELRILEGLLPHADFVGEIGLDYKDAPDEIRQGRQREALAEQMGWAESRRLPVNLHTRRADRALLEAAIAFRERTGLGALLHWFTHSAKLGRTCADRGIFISPGPAILFDARSAEVARGIDAAILLVETDAPVAYGGEEEARPSWAARVLAALAAMRGEETNALQATVAGNLETYLGRSAGAGSKGSG